MTQLFSNNASSTLANSITNVATSISFPTGEGSKFNSPVSPDYELLTITDGTSIEIVKVTARSVDTVTVVRGQEGTTATAWNAGTTIEGRITKGSLDIFLQSHDNDVIIGKTASTSNGNTGAISIGSLATSSSSEAITVGSKAITTGIRSVAIGSGAGNPDLNATLLTRVNSTAYVDGDVRLISGSRCVCIASGTSGGSSPSILNPGDTFLDGSVVWRNEGISNTYAVAVGYQSTSGNNSISIGLSSSAFNESIAIGENSSAASLSTAIGPDAVSMTTHSTSIGRKCKNYTIANSLAVSNLPSMEHPFNWNMGSEYYEYLGLSGQLASEYIDLTGGATWTATTAIRHGYIVKPTVSNNCQYIRYDNDFDAWNDPKLLGYVIGSTGSTQPTWPTTLGSSVTDGSGDWVCIPNTGGYVMTLPGNLLIEEVFFVCYEASGISAQANISIGTTGDLTKVINNQPTVGLTANNTVTKWTLSQPIIVPDITIKIDTLATGTKMLGKFMFRGFYTKFI